MYRLTVPIAITVAIFFFMSNFVTGLTGEEFRFTLEEYGIISLAALGSTLLTLLMGD